MKVDLSTVLSVQSPLLGAKCENLGRAKRVYLSYDRTTGWAVQDFRGCLGFVKKILRALGFYSSTHLKNIASQMQREANVPQQLLNKINACWVKKAGRIPTHSSSAQNSAPNGPLGILTSDRDGGFNLGGLDLPFLDANGQGLVRHYLEKLQGSADYRDSDDLEKKSRRSLTARLDKILLLMANNQEYRDKLLCIFEGLRSNPTCGDGVMVLFHDIEVQWHIYHKEHTLQERADLAARTQRFFDLKAHAVGVHKERSGDQAEIILAYQIKSKERLQLPISTQNMLYPFCASFVNDEKLAAAEEKIDLSQLDLLGRCEWWREDLKNMNVHYRAELDEVDVIFGVQLEQLGERADQMTSQAYVQGCNEIVVNRETALQNKTREITARLGADKAIVLKPSLAAQKLAQLAQGE